MDSATAHGMTKFGFRCYSRNHKAVMLRVVAASMVECQGYMDSATARGMTGEGAGIRYFTTDARHLTDQLSLYG